MTMVGMCRWRHASTGTYRFKAVSPKDNHSAPPALRSILSPSQSFVSKAMVCGPGGWNGIIIAVLLNITTWCKVPIGGVLYTSLFKDWILNKEQRVSEDFYLPIEQ